MPSAPAASSGTEAGKIVLRPFPATSPRVLLIGVLDRRAAGAQRRHRQHRRRHRPRAGADHPAHAADLHRHSGRASRRGRAAGRRTRRSTASRCVPATSTSRPAAATCGLRGATASAVIALDDGAAGQFLQAGGRSAVRLGGRGVGQPESGADPDRHGHRRHCAARRRSSPPAAASSRRTRHQRGLGHAGLGRPCRRVLGRAAARSDRDANCPPVRRRPVVTPLDYDYLRKLLKERSGLVLSADKQYLVESRLLPVARRAGLAGLGDLVQKLKRPQAEPLVVEVVEAMTTNESFFFRDKIPFEHFRDTIMPALLAARARPAPHPHLVRRRLDRAGALFARHGVEGDGRQQLAGWRIEIVATDLSNEVLEKAQGRHLQPVRGAARPADPDAGEVFHARSARPGRSRPTSAPWCSSGRSTCSPTSRHLGTFDLVFCRNVLIYFDQATKIDVLDRIARITERGRLSGARRRRDGGRPDRQLQADRRPARALRAERGGAQAGAADCGRRTLT